MNDTGCMIQTMTQKRREKSVVWCKSLLPGFTIKRCDKKAGPALVCVPEPGCRLEWKVVFVNVDWFPGISEIIRNKSCIIMKIMHDINTSGHRTIKGTDCVVDRVYKAKRLS
jgi:hypothetical protein